jgi:hypothetical protein
MGIPAEPVNRIKSQGLLDGKFKATVAGIVSFSVT